MCVRFGTAFASRRATNHSIAIRIGRRHQRRGRSRKNLDLLQGDSHIRLAEYREYRRAGLGGHRSFDLFRLQRHRSEAKPLPSAGTGPRQFDLPRSDLRFQNSARHRRQYRGRHVDHSRRRGLLPNVECRCDGPEIEEHQRQVLVGLLRPSELHRRRRIVPAHIAPVEYRLFLGLVRGQP